MLTSPFNVLIWARPLNIAIYDGPLDMFIVLGPFYIETVRVCRSVRPSVRKESPLTATIFNDPYQISTASLYH